MSSAPCTLVPVTGEPTRSEPAPSPRARKDIDELPRRPVSRIHRLTLTLWLLAAGVMIGGVAIPHAQDKPRVVPKSEDAPNAICLAPRP